MGRIHALVISAAVAFAVAAGTFAALRTTQLDTTSGPTVSPAVVLREQRAVAKAQRALVRALRQKPPKLPALPKIVRPAAPRPVVAPVAAPAPRVAVTQRPPATRTSSSPAAGRSGEHDGGDSYDD